MIQTIVGISFNPTDNKAIDTGSEISITHDPTNKFSSRAIAVHFGAQLLGHIGEKNNPKHEEIFNALPLKATVNTLARLAVGEKFGKFKEGEITHLEVEFKMKSDTNGMVKSWNEEEWLTFSEQDHRYVHEGKELVSCSNYIKKWMKPFEKDVVSGLCANKYGCTQEEVLGLWENGGKVSATFGTSIHNALEHYEKFKILGRVIQEQKDLPYNKALPSHPALREIVLEFTQNFTHMDDEVIPEALITNVELGLCGYADRVLITGEKKCRVQDYKINIGADVVDKNVKFLGQMADLPKTKLSKYALQMSFYARLLELSGWEVEGLTAFVYDDKWKKFELERIKLDF